MSNLNTQLVVVADHELKTTQTVAQRIRALQAEAKALGNDMSLTLLRQLNELEKLAQDVAQVHHSEGMKQIAEQIMSACEGFQLQVSSLHHRFK